MIQSTPGTNQVSTFPFCDSVHTWHKPCVPFPILWFSPHLGQTKCSLSHSVIQSTSDTQQVSTVPFCDSVHTWHKSSVHFAILWFSPQLPHAKRPPVHSRRDSRNQSPSPMTVAPKLTHRHPLRRETFTWPTSFSYWDGPTHCDPDQWVYSTLATYSHPQPRLRPLLLRNSHPLTNERAIFFYGKGPHQLLWTGLRATSWKITSGTPNGLNYCGNYIATLQTWRQAAWYDLYGWTPML